MILSLTLCCHRPLNAYVFYTRSTQQSAKAQLIGFLYFGTNLLTSNIVRHSSESPFSTSESCITPALLTRMSTCPNSSLACRIRPCACSSSVTSHSTESAWPPLPFVRSTRSSSRSSPRCSGRRRRSGRPGRRARAGCRNERDQQRYGEDILGDASSHLRVHADECFVVRVPDAVEQQVESGKAAYRRSRRCTGSGCFG